MQVRIIEQNSFLFLSSFSGETITLRCDFSVSSDDYLSTCQWTHMVDDDYVVSL